MPSFIPRHNLSKSILSIAAPRTLTRYSPPWGEDWTESDRYGRELRQNPENQSAEKGGLKIDKTFERVSANPGRSISPGGHYGLVDVLDADDSIGVINEPNKGTYFGSCIFPSIGLPTADGARILKII